MIRDSFENLPTGEIERRVRERDFFASTALKTAPQFDPIFTPILTSIFTSIGFTGTIFGVSTAGLLGSLSAALVTTALTIGIQAMMAPKPPKPEDGKSPMTQSVPFVHWVIGTTRMAGAYMLWDAVGSRLFACQAIAGHQVQSFNRFYLHDDEVTKNSAGVVNGMSDGRYGDGKVSIFHRLGANPETPYAELVTPLSASGLWTNNHRGDGQASVAMIAKTPKGKDFSKRFPYNIPRLSVEVSGAKVWDFRDPSQSPTNPSTWTFSKNPVLQLAWHWCFSEFGHKRDYRRLILPVLDMWIEEANVCDELVALAGGGSERRYECSGWDTTEREPKVGTNAILATCDGWICERGDGALLITVGKFRETRVVTLNEKDILGRRVADDVLFEEEINRLVPKFNYPDVDYATADTDFFEDQDRQLIAGRVLSEDGNYQWCTSWTQARRLGWRDWQRTQEKVKGALNVRLAGINAVYARWIRLETPTFMPRHDGALIENRRAVLDLMRGGFTLDFTKHPENIDQWTTAMQGQKPPVPPKPSGNGVSAPSIISAAAVASSGSVFLRVTIQDPDDDSLTLAVRYRTADTGDGAGSWVEKIFNDISPSGGTIRVSTDIVPSNRLLDVQAALISSKGSYSEFSPSTQVFSTADPTAPGLVTGVTVSTGAGVVNFGWTAPNSDNYAGAKLYWNTTNSFSSASFLGPIEYGAANASDSASRNITAGTRYGWITSVNRSGVESAPVATGAFVVG